VSRDSTGGKQTAFFGKAWVFGENVTTDDILPGKYLDRANHEVGALAMSGIDSEFATKVAKGDFIVAGPNFGMGSGRESAPMAIKLAGIAAVIAPSYSRLFYRNAINLGLAAVMVDDVSDIAPGDPLVLDLAQRVVKCGRTDRVLPIRNLTGTSLAILEAGGIVPYTKKRLGRA
jgi:3-isopropylmalate dehydratase small subunit